MRIVDDFPFTLIGSKGVNLTTDSHISKVGSSHKIFNPSCKFLQATINLALRLTVSPITFVQIF